MSEMGEAIFKSKKALPNKLMQEDGSITDMLGNPVTDSVTEYDSKTSLPNKWMNPDGSYSTLNEIIAGAIDTDLFIIVQELPATGEDNKIYLVPKDGGTGFVEWIYADGQWDTIGELEIDLSDYPTIEDMQQYVNEKIAQQSFGWTVGSGSFDYGAKHSSSEILNMWNEIQNSNKITDVFVFVAFSPNLYIFKIDKNALNVENTTVNIRSINQIYNNTNDASDSRVMYGQMGYLYVAINASGKITSVTTNYDRTSSYGGYRVLLTGQNYSTPYIPQYPGSPATKKYVDDAIATNITTMLNGNY